MEAPYTLDRYVEDLRRITGETDDEDEILERIAPLAQRLAKARTWLQPKHYETDSEQGFGVFLLHEEMDHSLAVLVVNWLPSRGAPPHDHGTWAVVVGVEGTERDLRYQRIDDRSRPDFAALEIKSDSNAGPGDIICMRTGAIHAVRNETDKVTLSLHTYGRHISFTNRSQFNLDSGEKKEFVVHFA